MEKDLRKLEFAALKPQEKKKLIYKIAASLNQTMADVGFRQKFLAQLLFVERCCNFYRQIEERLPAPMPELIPELMEKAWGFLLGELPMEELSWFEQASRSVVVGVNVGEDEGQEKFPEFWEKYYADWESALSCNLYLPILNAASDLLCQADSGEINWYELTDGELMGVIAEYISDGNLESVYKKESGGYRYPEIECHLTELFDSPTFGRVFGRLQEDLCLASELKEEEQTREKLLELREEYRGKLLFGMEEIDQIIEFLEGYYRPLLGEWKEEAPAHVTLELNARFLPMDRADFEDALEDVLEQLQMGEIDGGGTMQMASGEVKFCDITICLRDGSQKMIDQLAGIVSRFGVPKGSRIYGDGFELPVGEQEGLAIYLNGTELPDEVYASCDINYVVEQMNELMGEAGTMYSHWQGPKDTALYFYGASFEKMRQAVAGFVAEYPLCQKCRIEQIA